MLRPVNQSNSYSILRELISQPFWAEYHTQPQPSFSFHWWAGLQGNRFELHLNQNCSPGQYRLQQVQKVIDGEVFLLTNTTSGAKQLFPY